MKLHRSILIALGALVLAVQIAACGGTPSKSEAQLLRTAQASCPNGIEHIEFSEYGPRQITQLTCKDGKP